jgi:hypothetical protein
VAFQDLPDGALAVIEYGSDTQQWTNTLWFTQQGFGSEQMDDLLGLVATWADVNIMPALADFWERRQVTIYDMRSSIGAKLTGPGGGDMGGRTGNPGAVNIALVATFYSTQRGKSGRGRNYIAGFSEDDTSTISVNTAAVVTLIEDAYAALFALAAAQSWAWVIASRQLDGVPRESMVAQPVVSTAVRNSIFGTQRRRIDRP